MTRYLCDDGNAEVEYESDSPDEAAQQYVDDGEWGEIIETCWLHIWVTPLDEDGNALEDKREGVYITLHPDVPDCEGERTHPDCEPDEGSHDWHSPYEVVGGIESNPGVWGHGGGVVIKEVCANCGLYRITDTWAQDGNTGRQGLESVSYDESDENSLRWVHNLRREQDDAES